MLILNWGFAVFWTWVGMVMGAFSFFAGAPEPLIGYAVVTLIVVFPLAVLDFVDEVF